jgi:hypothetical protein
MSYAGERLVAISPSYTNNEGSAYMVRSFGRKKTYQSLSLLMPTVHLM